MSNGKPYFNVFNLRLNMVELYNSRINVNLLELFKLYHSKNQNKHASAPDSIQVG